MSLQELFEATTFFHQKPDHLAWDYIRISPDDEAPAGIDVYVPQCTPFASSNIVLSDLYERSGYDCLFIQELVRLYASGELSERPKNFTGD